MSALEWGPADLGRAGGAAPRRPHLVVLPGGAGQPSLSGPLRITRRGRLALVGLVLAAATVVGLTTVGGAGATEPPQVLTVASGQTLSEIALAELPQMSISQGILAIQLANKLSTAQVSAGQQLVIPR